MSDILRILPDPAALAHAATDRFIELARESIRARGRFSVALSGGSTPKAMNAILAGETAAAGSPRAIDWPRVHIFFGDERCVPPDHPDSNYRMARETLLSRVSIPADQIHRIKAELPPAQAAADYDAQLRLALDSSSPRHTFDLILLGMGPDGHTLSLFPGHDFTADGDRLAIPMPAPPLQPRVERITLTLSAVALARHALFLIAGPDKAKPLAAVRASRPTGRPDLPASLVHCQNAVEWFTDAAAAG